MTETSGVTGEPEEVSSDPTGADDPEFRDTGDKDMVGEQKPEDDVDSSDEADEYPDETGQSTQA